MDRAVYIGITSQGIRARWSRHVSAIKRQNEPHCKILAARIKRHGIDRYDIRKILECSSYEYLLDMERAAIMSYKTFWKHGGCNCTAGGEGSVGAIRSEETRRRLSVARRKRVITDETRRRLSVAGMGRTATPETRMKLSIANTGKRHKEESKRKMSETKRKIKMERMLTSEQG